MTGVQTCALPICCRGRLIPPPPVRKIIRYVVLRALIDCLLCQFDKVFFSFQYQLFFPAPVWRFTYLIHYFSLQFWSQSNCTSPRIYSFMVDGGEGTPTSTRIDWWESCDGNNHPIRTAASQRKGQGMGQSSRSRHSSWQVSCSWRRPMPLLF